MRLEWMSQEKCDWRTLEIVNMKNLVRPTGGRSSLPEPEILPQRVRKDDMEQLPCDGMDVIA